MTSSCYLLGGRVSHNQIANTSDTGIEFQGWDCSVDHNWLWNNGIDNIHVSTTSSGNVFAHNHCIGAALGNGIGLNGKDNNVFGNVCRAAKNSGIAELGTRQHLYNNKCDKNGLPAIITGSVDTRTLTYPLGSGTSFTAGNDDTAGQTMSLSVQGAYDPQQLITRLNQSSCVGMTWTLDSSYRLICTSLNGGAAATLSVTANAITATLGLTVNAVTNKTATGTAPAVGDLTSGGTGTVRKGNRLSTGNMWGTVTLAAGASGDIATVEVRTGDQITLTRSTAGGALGHLSYVITNATKFVITSSSATDTSTILWEIVH
jgi:hypothetical protein